MSATILGFSYQELDSIGRVAMIVGIITGAIALCATSISSIALYFSSTGYQAAANAQHDADARSLEMYKVRAKHDADVKIATAEANAKADAEVKIRAASNAADIKIEETKKDAATANREAARANESAERLRAANLDLENAVTPRWLEQKLTAKALSKFSGISFVVVSSPDIEPRRTAGQIRYVLADAHWKMLRFPGFSPGYSAGVVVHKNPPQNLPQSQGMERNRLLDDAVGSLVKILNENGIAARVGATAAQINAVDIVIEVGPKPLPSSMQIKTETVPTDELGNRVWGNTLE